MMLKTTNIWSMVVVLIVGHQTLRLADASTSCYKPLALAKPHDCCTMPKVHDDALIEPCIVEHSGQAMRIIAEYSGSGPIRGSCLAECVMNVTGSTLDEGGLQKKLDKLDNLPGVSEEWKATMRKSVETCHTIGMGLKPMFQAGYELPPLEPNDKVCHPKYQFGMVCGIRELINNCPAEFIVDSEECAALRDFAQECTF